MATALQRAHLAGLMDMMVKFEPLIGYEAQRPMTTMEWHEQHLLDYFRKKGKIEADCSEMCTLLCKMAGLKDPNGLNYNHQGFTGTMLSHLKSYSDPRRAQTGALVVFGPGSGDHVCMVRTSGRNPKLLSHGQESGPKWYSLADEAKAHRSPTRFLDISGL